MAGLCEGGNERAGSLKAISHEAPRPTSRLLASRPHAEAEVDDHPTRMENKRIMQEEEEACTEVKNKMPLNVIKDKWAHAGIFSQRSQCVAWWELGHMRGYPMLNTQQRQLQCRESEEQQHQKGLDEEE
ncbi:hypothetical protein ANN_21911 [Periplaneta americana]|uniref:Uncharacterized protein n=1 Tax=Periplaneta americana TaxID=6978 RepID=A0ABQ8S717_PERAM|nr:hypothetical protein ANN_21911 [Periplaneta americana]